MDKMITHRLADTHEWNLDRCEAGDALVLVIPYGPFAALTVVVRSCPSQIVPLFYLFSGSMVVRFLRYLSRTVQ